MDIMKSAGVRGKRNQVRIDADAITEDFVVEFPLTTFQKQVVELIYFMRTLKTSQIVEITGYSYDYVIDQMLKLYLNRFVQINFPPRVRDQKGTNEAYYFLDDAGAIYISGSFEIQMKEVKWRKRDNLIKVEKLEHTFAIGDVRANIEREARDKNHKILRCIGDRHLDTSFTYEKNPFEFRPDMYLRYYDGKNAYDFLFEVDMGTMNFTGLSAKTQAFDKKVPIYELYRASEEYKKTFDRFPRVIVVTTTTDRAKKLREAVKWKQKTEKVEFFFTTFTLWKEAPLAQVCMDVDGNYRTILDERI